MKKVLVIDDADFILESTSTLLDFEGYNVITASDGLSGIEAAFEHYPDLILCDISMPKLDGYGVLERIRDSSETNTIPFIFLTAFTEKANMRQGMEKGADDFLVKPFTREELLAAIEAQWNKHSIFEKKTQEKIEEVGRTVTSALPHEFRTVLNQVVGAAKYLNSNSNDVTPEEIKEFTQDVMSSSQRLLKITENFLVFVRIESFASNPEKRKSLRQFKTDEPCAMIADLADIKANDYERTEDLITQGYVENIYLEISTESLHKIVTELIDNAFNFSEKGAKVYVNMRRDKGLLYTSIKDEGRGMSPEQISGVGAYVQFERSIYEQQGVGLGLVISKRLVELHDGTFEIESEEGSGTIVTFSIPCKETA